MIRHAGTVVGTALFATAMTVMWVAPSTRPAVEAIVGAIPGGTALAASALATGAALITLLAVVVWATRPGRDGR